MHSEINNNVFNPNKDNREYTSKEHKNDPYIDPKSVEHTLKIDSQMKQVYSNNQESNSNE